MVQANDHFKSVCDGIIMHLQISRSTSSKTRHWTLDWRKWQLNKMHDFSKVFWAFTFFFFPRAWNNINLKFFDFPRLSVTVGTLCICPVLNDHALTKGLHLYSLNNLPLPPSFPSPALIWDRWREHAEAMRSRLPSCLKSVQVEERWPAEKKNDSFAAELHPDTASSIFPSLKTVHRFLTSLLWSRSSLLPPSPVWADQWLMTAPLPLLPPLQP